MNSRSGKLMVVLGSLLAFAMGLGVYYLVKWTEVASHYMMSRQTASDYLNAFGWAFFFALLINFAPLSRQIKTPLVILWAIRCFVTLVVMLYYENNYNLDAYMYHNEIIKPQLDINLSFTNGTHFIIWLGRVVNSWLPVYDSFHSLKVIWSFIGFIGTYQFYRTYILISKRQNPTLLWMLCLFPAILFWTSTLGKDPIAILGIGMTTYGLVSLHQKITLGTIISIVAGLVIMTMTRYWLASIFTLPALISITLTQKRMSYAQMFGVLAVGAGIYFFLQNLMSAFFILRGEEYLETLNVFSSSWSKGGSALEVKAFTGTLDIIKFYPLGLFTALFRPLPGDVMNVFGFVAGLESLCVLLIAFMIYKRSKIIGIWNGPILYLILCIFTWGSLYAYISYQNLGTGARFRTQIIPSLILLLFIFGHHINAKMKNMEEKSKQDTL